MGIAAGPSHSMVLLTQDPPLLQVFLDGSAFAADKPSFDVPTQSGRVYRLECANSIGDSEWKAMPLVPGNGQVIHLTDPSRLGKQRFYRVRRW